MSKRMFIDIVRESTGCTNAVARQTATAMIDGIVRELKRNGKFVISGFGAFSVHRRAARKGINPATREPIKIKASKTVRFRPSKGLKSVV